MSREIWSGSFGGPCTRFQYLIHVNLVASQNTTRLSCHCQESMATLYQRDSIEQTYRDIMKKNKFQ